MVPGFIDDPKTVCIDKHNFLPFLTVVFQTQYVLLREIPICVCKILTSCTFNKKLTFSVLDCPVLALVFYGFSFPSLVFLYFLSAEKYLLDYRFACMVLRVLKHGWCIDFTILPIPYLMES